MSELSAAMNFAAGAEIHTMSGRWSILSNNWLGLDRHRLGYYSNSRELLLSYDVGVLEMANTVDVRVETPRPGPGLTGWLWSFVGKATFCVTSDIPLRHGTHARDPRFDSLQQEQEVARAEYHQCRDRKAEGRCCRNRTYR